VSIKETAAVDEEGEDDHTAVDDGLAKAIDFAGAKATEPGSEVDRIAAEIRNESLCCR
jgi:hypothetical protein